MLIATIWHKVESSPGYVNLHDISCCCASSYSHEVFLSVALRFRHNPTPIRTTGATLIELLLILSGHVEMNPGTPTKFPCGECSKAVRWGDQAMSCDSCNQWYHYNCIEMSSQVYNALADTSLEWECCNCGLMNISITVFNSFSSSNSLNDSVMTSSPLNISKKIPKQLRILVVNLQSIWGKKEQVEQALIESEIDVVIGSESHLDPSIKDSEFLPMAYTCFRRDRNDSKGGVIIIAKKELITEEVLRSNTCEVLAIKVQSHNHPLILAACYRPPGSNLDETSKICNEIRKLNDKYKNCPIWVGGDTNLPDIDWSSNSIVSHQYSKQINECFIDTFDYCCLDQIVDFPTRKQNTLDILATNRPTLVNKCSPHPGVSEHDTTVLADINCHPMRSKPVKRKIFLWNKTDINKLKDHVSTKVDKFVQIHDTNTPVNFLWADLKQIIDTSMLLVPSKLTSPRYSQPWITRECK